MRHAGVKLEIKFSGKNKPVSPTQLVEEYFAWLEEMHSKYDEEVTFLDEPAWLFSHPNADKELGVYKQGVGKIVQNLLLLRFSLSSLGN